MNVLFFCIRLLLGIFLFLFSIFLLIEKEGDVKAGVACSLVCLFVLFPAFRSYNKKFLPISSIKGDFNETNMLAWVRKVLAVIISIIGGLGAFGNGYNAVGCAVILICLILLSPLDDIIFGRNKAVPDWDGPDISHVYYRNGGLFCYFCGVCVLTAGYNTVAYILLLAGLIMVLIPVLKYTKPIEFAPDHSFVTPEAAFAEAKSEPEVAYAETESETEPEVAYPDFESEMEKLRIEYAALFHLDPHRRGYAFQDFLNSLFRNFSGKSAFRLTGEEIDGSFEIDSQIYLLEAKWQAMPSGQRDLLVFNGKVEGKSTWARGIFISYAGFTKEGLIAFARGKRTSIIGMDGNDISLILDEKISLTDAIKRKARRAVETNDFFVSLEELL